MSTTELTSPIDVSPPPEALKPSKVESKAAKPEPPTKPEPPVQEIIDFAISFSSLGKLPQQKLRLRSSISDLLHTLGYYTEQVKGVNMTNAARLALIAEAIHHISDNLGTL